MDSLEYSEEIHSSDSSIGSSDDNSPISRLVKPSIGPSYSFVIHSMTDDPFNMESKHPILHQEKLDELRERSSILASVGLRQSSSD